MHGTDSSQQDSRTADEMSLMELLAEDFHVHEDNLVSPGFWALTSHRLGSRIDRLPQPAKLPFKLAHRLFATAVDWTWGIQIPVGTRLGRRIRIWHFGSVLLNARSIGNDVHIRHDTTFGPMRASDGQRPEALPIIEDAVDVGSGACVMGGVTVGRGAKVGANSVVIEPVPAGATVFGVPSRVIAT